MLPAPRLLILLACCIALGLTCDAQKARPRAGKTKRPAASQTNSRDSAGTTAQHTQIPQEASLHDDLKKRKKVVIVPAPPPPPGPDPIPPKRQP